MINSVLIEHLKEYSELKVNEPMKQYTSLRIGGPADIFMKISNMENLVYLLDILKQEGISITLLGEGTNVLILDEGIRGAVIKLTDNFSQIQLFGGGLIDVGAGVSINNLVRFCCEVGLSGLEQLSGLPGSVGGALYGNSGAFSRSIGDLVLQVTIIKNADVISLDNKDIEFFYRGSNLKDCVITSCRLKLVPSNTQKVQKNSHYFLSLRKKKQPTSRPTAGCIFKNPKEDLAAGWLIDVSGCKGMGVGKVRISQKHANFIENLNGGRSTDVLTLIEKVKECVYKKFALFLQEEIQIIS